jgi:uncharacterized protein
MASNQSGGSGHPGEGQRGGSGNFSNDPHRASDVGKKGGQPTHGHPDDEDDSEMSRRSGSGNFSSDKEKGSDAGRKGGQPHGGSPK